MIQYCPYCGEELAENSAFCGECGERIPAEPMVTCPKCGEENKPKARFCKKCGDKIVHPADMVICPECGEVSYDTADFCMHCGEEFCWDAEEEDDFDDSHLAWHNAAADPHEKIDCKDMTISSAFSKKAREERARMSAQKTPFPKSSPMKIKNYKYLPPHLANSNYKSKSVAVLLCIFLGLLGMHQFYLGKTGRGLVYLLCNLIFWFTGIVPLVFLGICVLDLIYIAGGVTEDAYGRPLI